MMKFTGERVIRHRQSNIDLNYLRHLAAYRFVHHYLAGKRVLELGCGSGYGVLAMETVTVNDFFAVDLDLQAVRYAKNLSAGMAGIHYGVTDGCHLMFSDHVFDLVYSFQVIEHVKDQAGFMAEMIRVTRPGGTILFSTPNRITYQVENRGKKNPFHHHEFDLGELDAFLKEFNIHFEIKGIAKSARLQATDQQIQQNNSKPVVRLVRKTGLIRLVPYLPTLVKRLAVTETKTDKIKRAGIDVTDFPITDEPGDNVLDFLVICNL